MCRPMPSMLIGFCRSVRIDRGVLKLMILALAGQSLQADLLLNSPWIVFTSRVSLLTRSMACYSWVIQGSDLGCRLA